MAMPSKRVMVGTFESPGDARRAIEDLLDARFSDRDIGVLTHDREGDAEVTPFRKLEGSQAALGAALGVAAGAGGGALWALGIAAGFLPAIGPVLAGGLLVALAASTASGAATGLVVGSLLGLGVPDVEAAFYEEAFRKGHTIVVVQGDERTELAQTILAAHHAHGRQVTPDTLAQQIEARSGG